MKVVQKDIHACRELLNANWTENEKKLINRTIDLMEKTISGDASAEKKLNTLIQGLNQDTMLFTLLNRCNEA